jgi:hypothetical protein
LLLLKLAFFMGGGLVAVVGYVFVAWTPLMNSLPFPQWMSNAIVWVVDLGSDPKEEEKKSDDESDSDDDGEGTGTTAGGPASGEKGTTAGGPAEGTTAGGPSSGGWCQSVTEGIKTIGRYGAKVLGGLSKLKDAIDYARRNMITVHLKIIISYVQVPTRALCRASNHHRCMTNTRSDPLFLAGSGIICVIQRRVALGCFFCHEHKSCVSVQR